MVAARRRSASSGPLRGLQRHVRRRARAWVKPNPPAMPTIGEGGLIPPISGQSRQRADKSRASLQDIVEPIHVGRLRHKGKVHAETHLAMVDQTTGDRVGWRLAEHTRNYSAKKLGFTFCFPSPKKGRIARAD